MSVLCVTPQICFKILRKFRTHVILGRTSTPWLPVKLIVPTLPPYRRICRIVYWS